MKSLVFYESWFGNTRRIANEVALALSEEGEAELVRSTRRYRRSSTWT
jgi:menaquinone-dependent protoporphyrinogen IX oxidase